HHRPGRHPPRARARYRREPERSHPGDDVRRLQDVSDGSGGRSGTCGRSGACGSGGGGGTSTEGRGAGCSTGGSSTDGTSTDGTSTDGTSTDGTSTGKSEPPS